MTIDIDEAVAQATKQFGNRRPTAQELKTFVVGLGVAEATLLLAALTLIYDILRANQKAKDPSPVGPSCVHSTNGTPCGAKIIHSEIDDDGAARFLVQICAKKHEVRRALPKRA